MATILQFRQRGASRFGSCPECARATGILNIGKAHWRYCERHKTKWLVGHSLFSDWLNETPGVWLGNSRHLAEFREVKPLDWQWVEASDDKALRVGELR
jgi:hypothetical protein